MSRIEEHPTSLLAAVSNAMVALHKEQFGRGPTAARSHFAGADALLCILQDALLPAERKLVAMGEEQRVRESRVAFHAATSDELIRSVEEIVGRRVCAFGSAVDVAQNVVFESFIFEPDGRDPSEDAHGAVSNRSR